MRILVTGGAGFIGSNLVHHLLATRPDDEVVVLDSLTYAGNRQNLERWEEDPRFTFLRGDITDSQAVDQAMAGVAVVFHLAAESHVDRSILDGTRFVTTNVTGTHVLLEAARRHDVSRFVHVSTDEVYGSIEQGSFREGDRLAPSSPYSASKASSDLVALSHFRTYGTPVMVTRATNNFGPYQYPEKLIPFFISRALQDVELPVYGDGLQCRDWLYVEDHCSALVRVAEQGAPGQTYNVGAGNELANLDITRTLLRLLDKPESLIRHVTDRPGHDRRYSVDVGRMKELGWEPVHDFASALEKTVRWYVDNRGWWEAVAARGCDYQQFVHHQYSGRLA